MNPSQQDSTGRVRIFDTTLRDGEQSPGASLTSDQKVEIARLLAELGVDVIEAGFPAASPDDFEAVRRIAQEFGASPSPIICGLARATRRDVDAAFEALRGAARGRIHTFIATSPVHREHKLRMTTDEVLCRTREMVAYAAALCSDVQFSAEDAVRTEPEFLLEVVQAAIESGASTINVPDTVGYALPHDFGHRIAELVERSPDHVTFSVHCHDDLGLATANSLAGLLAGARQAEVTINGLGERAGNCSLEELVMTLATHRARLGLTCGVDTTRLNPVSRAVSAATGIVVQPNKAIVGSNAFAHEAGIHQDGMLKHVETYEIMRPETVGVSRSQLVLGKHSGRHAFERRLAELGFRLAGDELDRAFARFKRLADRRKQITEDDLRALGRGLSGVHEAFGLLDLQVVCGSHGLPTATVRLSTPEGGSRVETAVGTGPVHATFQAIDRITEAPAELEEYSVRSVTEGIDALGEVSVRIRCRVEAGGERAFHGHASDTDVVLASALAYLSAQNRMLAVTSDATTARRRAQ